MTAIKKLWERHRQRPDEAIIAILPDATLGLDLSIRRQYQFLITPTFVASETKRIWRTSFTSANRQPRQPFTGLEHGNNPQQIQRDSSGG